MGKRNFSRGADRGAKISVEKPKGFRGSSYGPAGSVRSLITGEIVTIHHPPFTKKLGRPPSAVGRSRSVDVSIVVGADQSPTGERQVFIFATLADAHRAGFTWAV